MEQKSHKNYTSESMLLVWTGILPLITLLLVIIYQPDSGSIWFEAGKVSLQVLGVLIIGSLVTRATFLFQQRRTEQATIDAKDRAEKREDWARDIKNRIDERARQDTAARAVLDQTISAYHSVKRIRRLLKAETRLNGARCISRNQYDTYLRDLNDQQLVFESLKRIVPTISDGRLNAGSPEADASRRTTAVPLNARFAKIEKYLNDIVKEYEDNRYLVPENTAIALAELSKLNLFVNDSNHFIEGASIHVDMIVEKLHRALVEPLVLPRVDQG